MTRKRISIVLSLLIILLGIMSPNQWSKLPIGDTTINWIISFVIIAFVLWYKSRFHKAINIKDYKIVTIYFIWMLTCCIRGAIMAENYWEWKQLVVGSLALALPIFVYVFSMPELLHKVLKVWFKYSLPLFFLFFIWVLDRDAYHFYLGPILLLACFLPILEFKWKAILIGLLILMIFADFGARSQVIKSLTALMMSIAFISAKYISNRFIRIVHSLFYILPLILLTLGLTGQFNIFHDVASNEGKYIEQKKINGQIVEEDLSADTRSLIYLEVLESAIKNDYVLWGRTPARGNDSYSFGVYNAEELKTGKYERHSNELCFPNIFTWLGLVGLILYCLIYLQASYLAVYKSNNIFMQIVGIFIAFRFSYGWVEDFNRFDIMNISLWMMIAMGFSERFRSMQNQEFIIWTRSIFKRVIIINKNVNEDTMDFKRSLS